MSDSERPLAFGFAWLLLVVSPSRLARRQLAALQFIEVLLATVAGGAPPSLFQPC